MLDGPIIAEKAPSTKEALEIAARQFRQYEEHHRAEADKVNTRGIEDDRAFGDAVLRKTERNFKANANRLMAEMCEQAAAEVIAPPTPLGVVIHGHAVTLSYDSLGDAQEAHREINKAFARREAQKKDHAQ